MENSETRTQNRKERTERKAEKEKGSNINTNETSFLYYPLSRSCTNDLIHLQCRLKTFLFVRLKEQVTENTREDMGLKDSGQRPVGSRDQTVESREVSDLP